MGGSSVMRNQRNPHGVELPVRYLSPTEVAELLGVPVETVYQWRYKRTGPPGFRVGRHLRFDPRAVQRWVETQTESVA